MADKLKSRKLWLALAGAILVVLNKQFEWGFTEDVIESVLKFFALFVIPEGLADAGRAVAQALKKDVA